MSDFEHLIFFYLFSLMLYLGFFRHLRMRPVKTSCPESLIK